MGSLGVGMPEPFINQNVMGFFDFKGKGSIICIRHTSNIPRKQSWWNVDSYLRFPRAFLGIQASEQTVSISAQLQKLPFSEKWYCQCHRHSNSSANSPAASPGVLQVFRQQLALYLRAETHRRRDKKGEKVEKIEEVVEERHPGPSENTNTPSFMTDESTYHLKITKKTSEIWTSYGWSGRTISFFGKEMPIPHQCPTPKN